MKKKHQMKLIHEGQYIALVDVELIDIDENWYSYLSLADTQKLEDVRNSLRKEDLEAAGRLAKIFSLTPVTVRS